MKTPQRLSLDQIKKLKGKKFKVLFQQKNYSYPLILEISKASIIRTMVSNQIKGIDISFVYSSQSENIEQAKVLYIE